MKKVFSLALAFVACAASAQNIQVHYDFGSSIYSNEEGARQDATVTFEQFKADQTGSWFYFIDLDFDKNGVTGAYTEISREFNLSNTTNNSSIAAHIEYDGGLARGAGSFQQCGLAGVAWNGHSADFSKTYSVQALYKQFFGQEGGAKAYASFQLTGVWGINFADNKGTFSGFIDLWREKNGNKGKMVLLAEPQLWYNVNNRFSVGTEIEVSNNFVFNMANDKKFFVNPTIAVKYNL